MSVQNQNWNIAEISDKTNQTLLPSLDRVQIAYAALWLMNYLQLYSSFPKLHEHVAILPVFSMANIRIMFLFYFAHLRPLINLNQ